MLGFGCRQGGFGDHPRSLRVPVEPSDGGVQQLFAELLGVAALPSCACASLALIGKSGFENLNRGPIIMAGWMMLVEYNVVLVVALVDGVRVFVAQDLSDAVEIAVVVEIELYGW